MLTYPYEHEYVEPVSPTITLRPYQVTCVERVLTAYEKQPHGGKALIVLPTGGGKTIVFTEIARRLGLTTLIIAHRQELLQQAADKFRMVDPTAVIGQVGAGRHEYGAPITVASVQTISRPEHLKALRRFGYGLVIIDECFPAGTLIDGKPIERIQVGDLVTAYHEASHTFALKRVVRTFRRPVGSRLLKITAGTASVVCTPNHPFYTPSGWKSAQSLVLQEELLYVTSDPDHCPLHRMQPALPPHNAASAHAMEERQELVLLRRVQAQGGITPLVRNNGTYQSAIRIRAYEAQQSDEERGVSAQDAGNTSRSGSCSQRSQGQWNRTNGTSTSPYRAAGRGLAYGVRRQDPSSQDQPASRSDTLQTGYCRSSSDDWDRSRWNVPCEPEPSGTGPQERAGARWIRVDRIEVYEPGRDGTYGELCSDGYVYNFEVEDDHTYLANGFVVHNCHHSTADGYQAVLDVLSDAFVLGVTATPDRLDKQSIEHIFGEPVFSASIIDMVEQGYLCDLRAIAVKTTTSLDGVHTQAGDFKVDELEEAVDTPERNQRIVNAYLEHCQGRQTLCFTVTIHHAAHLADRFSKAGIRAAFVSGDTPPDERKRLLHDYERGFLDVLCNCGVLTEGYDAPQTSCIILARPTKSRALFVQCLDASTEVLTPSGWKSRNDVHIGDLVAGYDKDTERVHWVPALDKVERPLFNEETMFELQSPTLDIRVTGGHRMLHRTRVGRQRTRTNWQFIEAQDLYQRQLEYELPIAGHQDAPGVPLTDDELRFIGWFLSDGSLNRATGSIVISQAAHQPHHEAIRTCLEGCGFKYSVYEVTPQSQYHANSNSLRYTISKGLPRGRSKHLTGWGRLSPYIDKDFSPHLENMTAQQLEVMLEAIHLGDGAKQRGQTWTRRSYHIITANKTFAERLQSLCVRRGFKCNLALRQRENALYYMLHIKNTPVRYVGGYQSVDRPHLCVSPTTQHEIVWCVENRLGTLITRRNGKVAIVGNCIGRGTRLAPGKRDCIILDITDNCLRHRIEPVTLRSALGLHLQEGESITEAKVRERLTLEREQQERLTRVMQRGHDLAVNILARMDWKRQRNGSYVLEVGGRKHRIFLLPSETNDGYYSVHAELAPSFTRQQWLKESPLSWAQEHAEMKARLLQSDEKKLVLVDSNAPWRIHPASLKQIALLDKFALPHHADITSGEASDLIGREMELREKRKAEQKASKRAGKTRTSKKMSARA